MIFSKLIQNKASFKEQESNVISYLNKYNNQEKRFTASFTENVNPEGFYTLDSTALIRASLVKKSTKERKSSSY